MTRVIHLPTGRDIMYDLPPAQAVVAAFERNRRNSNWWGYAKPEDHPQYRRGHWGHHCGDFSARF